MVLGYNEKRPRKEQYDDFVKKLELNLRGLGNEGVSLMMYGSYIRGDYVPGRSDIDAVMVFPDDVVINKSNLHLASQAIARAQSGNNIPFQVTVTDLRTMRDGTFNSFDPNFEKYFDEEGRTITGPEYRKDFRYSFATHSDQHALRFNLRKSRLGLLFSKYNFSKNYEEMLESFKKTLDATSRASKQILSMLDGSLRKNRFSALEELSTTFPNLDTEPLERIKSLYTNLEELDELYYNPEELMKVWNNSVTFFESLVQGYLNKKDQTQKSRQSI